MTSSRRSSISADLSGDTKRSSQLKITKSVIAQLQKVAEQEEKELLVYAVREELMRRVMDEIYKRYLEQQSIRFTVDCAHKALVQILKTEFYVHDKGCPFYTSHPDWTPDAEPEPSAPDSWAAHNVRIRPRARPLPEVASESADSPGCAEALCTCGVSEENVALVGLDGVEPNGARRSTDRKYSMRKNARND